MRLLSELRTVIAVRAKQTIERERSALLRQNPDYKFDDDGETSISPATETETTSVSTESRENRLVENGCMSNDSSEIPVSGFGFLPSSGCMFTKEIARMAVTKSQHLPPMSVDTFGDDSDSSDNDDNDDDNANADSNDYDDYDDDGDSNCLDD